MKKNYLLLIAFFVFYSCSTIKQSKPVEVITKDAAPGTTGNSQSLIRVTSDPIPEFYPRISPDGKRMIFHIRDDNKKESGLEKFSIMMMNLGQPGRIPLIGSYTQQPNFFSDSKTIVYCYMKPSKPIIARSIVDGNMGINYISPNSMGDFDSHPCVSPDGKKILFATRFGGVSQIASVDINGMNATIYTEGSCPIYFHTGAKFIYTKMVGKYEQIFEYNFSSGQSLQLTNGEFDNSDPCYSSDGSYIVFASTRDNKNEQIFIMRSDGSQITQLTQGNSRNGMPVFAPNNDIYFCSNAGTTLTKDQIDNLVKNSPEIIKFAKEENKNITESAIRNYVVNKSWSASDIWKITPVLK